jgi:2-polyprenyl-3-methyl-5-hydroxy-6-metoxy-1,4-benzoquinol methylase
MDSHTKPKSEFCILDRNGAREPQSRTLEALSSASAYNDWIFSVFAEFIGDRALEIGCGTGNLTCHLLENAKEVTAIDIDAEYLQVLSRTVRVPEGHALTVRNQNFLEDMTDLAGFDSIVLINVLEHLAEPGEALGRIYEALMPGGRVIVLVPAFNFLFSHFDELIGHHRRYTLQTLASELTAAGFSIKKNVYFNFFGMAGWWWRFCVLKKKYLTKGSVRFFETLTPLLRAVESAVRLPVGLSAIAIGEKPLKEGAGIARAGYSA